MATAIKFDHVKKAFNGKLVVNDFNLDIQQGELFVLVGNSGSGKTTSIKMINRLEDPSTGQILVNDVPTTAYDLQKLRWKIGYVLQQIALFPNMTVAQNITLIPEIKKEQGDLKRLAKELLQDVGLNGKDYFDRYPHELSGGEQQRIGILRAIASKPPIVLMDEPFSALDPLSRTNLQNLVIDLHKELHNTIVFVTHDMNEALRLADRIGIMKDGNLLQVGRPQELLRHPATEYVQEFFRGCLANDLYQTPLRQAILFTDPKVYPRTPAAGMPVLSDDSNFEKLLNLLSRREEVGVQDPNGECMGYLDRRWVIKYLSEINDFS
ncbi:ABC transporter ATP-binding protein [Lactobacillus xylocopicola]|nr:ABC transporter ATP-binding protein [Lactobacillus xylocopicola]